MGRERGKLSYEEFYRRELELKTFHNPKVSIAQVRNECRERRMTYQLGKKKKTWIARFLGIMPGMKNSP